MKDSSTGETMTGWVVIPSKENDPENFEKNVEKLKTLSHNNWCTKSFNAEPYLSQGDFHVYLENGEPKLGVRFVGDKVQEIQGEKNNNTIPIAYLDECKRHINEQNIKLEEFSAKQITTAEETKAQIEKMKKYLEVAIKENDVATILRYFNIRVKEDKDGFLTLDKYNYKYNDNICFEDLDIDENKLFEKIKRIDGKLLLSKSKIKSLGALEHAEQLQFGYNHNAIIKTPNLKSVGTLYIPLEDSKQKEEILQHIEKIGSFNVKEFTEYFKANIDKNNFDAEKIFELCGIKTQKDKDGFLIISEYHQPSDYHTFAMFGIDENKLLEKVKKIKGDADFSNSNLRTLEYIESIEGSANFQDSNIKSLGKLKYISKDINLAGTNIKDLGSLKKIGGDAYLHNSKVESLKNLEYVGSNLNLSSSNIKNLGNLLYVGGTLNIESTTLKNLGKLKYVGVDIRCAHTKFKPKDFSCLKRNNYGTLKNTPKGLNLKNKKH